MFVDHVVISVKAGDGGNGAITFHREKYVPAGGPDGGDGGRGGSIIFRVDEGSNTLLAFRYKRKFIAERGADGLGGKMHGKSGEDVVITVPPGTLLRDPETKRIIFDMSRDREFVACKGGRGGWGNRHFATPTRQIPRFAKSGTKGEEREILLELKMLADVGLIGFPNVGKSTLLSRVSKARPKIADYHFTTLSPNLGVVSGGGDKGFVMADIPGLIEGASEGLGLGHDFLRHIDRCRLLIHIVDVSGCEGRDPIEDLEIIDRELAGYSPELASRPQIVVAGKCDALDPDSDNLARLEARAFASLSSSHPRSLPSCRRRRSMSLRSRPRSLRLSRSPRTYAKRRYARRATSTTSRASGLSTSWDASTSVFTSSLSSSSASFVKTASSTFSAKTALRRATPSISTILSLISSTDHRRKKRCLWT